MNFAGRQSINSDNSHYFGGAPISNDTTSNIRTSSSARPLTRSDTEVTLNTYWERLAAPPYMNRGSISFGQDDKNASGFPQAASNPLRRSDTVSSWNSTWDEHIISSATEGRGEGSFIEYPDDLPNTHREYGSGAFLAHEDDSQMSDEEDSDDTRTECGDSPSPPPSVPTTSLSSAAAMHYTGLMTRAQTRKIKQWMAGGAAPAQGQAHNKNSQQESVAWRKEGKTYWCNTCQENTTRKDLIKRHVHQQHPANESNPTGR